MAAGEFVSVSTQRDTEEADLRIEAQALEAHPEAEQRELALIYEQRGLAPDLASVVAHQLMAHDKLEAHARDELGITAVATARPFQAAWTSAIAFAVGAAAPLLSIALPPLAVRIPLTVAVALVALVLLGALGARAGGC
jgi:VIT1/CCC1 family predicted Fe2+/Mn2+ transporter